jgi:hypothetical protein
MIYSKGLNHNHQGFVIKEELNRLLAGEKFPNLVRFTYEDKCFTQVNNDLIELYILSLARDIPFDKYAFSVHTIDYQILKPQISQFLLQKQYYTDLEVDYLIDRDALISNQNGNLMITRQIRSTPRFIITGRDLSSIIKDLTIYEILIDVINTLFKLQPINYTKEEVISKVLKTGFKTSKCIYQQKWSHFKLRPEALALEVDRAIRTKHNRYNLPETLLNHDILKLIFLKQGNYLLSQAYSDGSELSPSYPELNSLVLRSSIDKLNEFFDFNQNLRIYEVINNQLVATNSMSNIKLELDKLVDNIGLASLYAGVNYRNDIL